MKSPKISIITCVLNSEKHLPECINSVNNQTYKNFEQVFIDGFSTDRTLEIIKKLQPKSHIYKEFGKGIYRAINKGLKMAKGEIIGFLHSDDTFADNQALARVATAFEKNPNLDFYCSRMLVKDDNLKNSFAILGAPPHKQTWKEALYSPSYYAHPTYYCRRSTIEKVGSYNVSYKIASDIDWLMRLEKLNLNWYFDKKPLIKFRSSDKSASTQKYFLALKEEFQIRVKRDGLSLFLLVIYGYHFCRRGLRFTLQKLHLNFLIDFFRKILIKFS